MSEDSISAATPYGPSSTAKATGPRDADCKEIRHPCPYEQGCTEVPSVHVVIVSGRLAKFQARSDSPDKNEAGLSPLYPTRCGQSEARPPRWTTKFKNRIPCNQPLTGNPPKFATAHRHNKTSRASSVQEHRNMIDQQIEAGRRSGVNLAALSPPSRATLTTHASSPANPASTSRSPNSAEQTKEGLTQEVIENNDYFQKTNPRKPEESEENRSKDPRKPKVSGVHFLTFALYLLNAPGRKMK
jgi:hypothetical protein